MDAMKICFVGGRDHEKNPKKRCWRTNARMSKMKPRAAILIGNRAKGNHSVKSLNSDRISSEDSEIR
eukprot:763957-Hanusia_phi.AAC.1